MARKKFQSKVISIRPLAKLAGIGYFKLYLRQKGVYKTELKQSEKTKTANALIRDITPFLADLGYDVAISPLKAL